MGLDIDIEVAVNSNVPLRRWMVNWTLSFLTQALAAPSVSLDIFGIQLLHMLSFASQGLTKQPTQVSMAVTVFKLVISAFQSLVHSEKPLRILMGLALATMGSSEVHPTIQHQFAMLFFWAFCDSNLYKAK